MPNKSGPHGGFVTAGSVSWGTLRTQDLLRSFADEYERLLPFNSRQRVADARELADLLDTDAATPADWEAGSDAVEALMDCLTDIAARERNGLYFGVSEGDGSDFGFWEMEEEHA